MSLRLPEWNLLTFPKDSHSLFSPSPPHLPAAQFTTLNLPYASRSSDIVTGSVESWFSFDAPRTPIDAIFQRSLPSRDIIQALLNGLGQFWLDGYQSVVDPRCNDGRDRFPLWVLKLWLELGTVGETQKSWHSAFNFLRRQAALKAPDPTRKAAEEMLELLERVGWNEPIGTTGLPATCLIRFLSKAWLSEEQISLQVYYMHERLQTQKPKTRNRVAFAPLLFTNKLVQTTIQAMYDYEHVKDSVMRKIEEQVYKEDIDILYMPAHVQNNHWIIMAANFKDGTVSFGDSLFDSPYQTYPRKLVQKLQLWSKKRFAVPLNDIGNTLPIGQQTDTMNCGVCWADAAMTAVWGDPQWKPELGAARRIQWAIRLAKKCASISQTIMPSALAPPPAPLLSARRYHLEIGQFLAQLSTAMPTTRPITLVPSLFGTTGVRLTQPTGFDYSALVSLRRQHQTRQAENGVRVRSQAEPASESAKRQLVKSMQAILKQTEARGLTTGVDRTLRTQSLGSGDPSSTTGNAANAAASAVTRAREALRKRRKLFADANVACLNEIEGARVSAVRPLLPRDWVLVAADLVTKKVFDVYLAQVLTLYARGAGKNGKHGLVVDGGKSNIAALSFIGVQLYELSPATGIFQSITQQTVHLDTSTFAHLPSLQILTVVKSPQSSQTGTQLALSDADFTLFSTLRGSRANISKALVQARKRKVVEEVEEDE
ncbi:hypothetical protein MIND_01129000 [Mycena indigotica]|uniref:Ubiquitin-like protease family profile domain-containing protein n=1 Tax=Mycena indigotica TaxID=2126181 RepID=A0A8H6VX87_9AGAR|nr:uncharacterized protein MIND_01129000 [Mycena indigotica]KAF7293508.1 hypothetical protein MIND_01129000 [Mycena indigotica]